MLKSDRLARILESPRIDRLVPRLQADVLHQIIERRGLEDSAEIVALATPAQLADVFDLDLWRSAQPGRSETFDAGRFGVWLDVLMESGAEVAAEKLMGIDAALVIGGLAQHLRVFDRAAATRRGFEVGSYLIEPKRTSACEAIVPLLLHLDAGHRDYFNELMRGCRRLSNDGFEADGLDDLPGASEQHLFDVALDREGRRETRGYVTPAQAHAFLQLARQRRDNERGTRNPIAAACFRERAPAPGLVRAGADVQSDRALEELAFLANALVAGCPVQGRAFTPGEASHAAAAVCKLGAQRAGDAQYDVIGAFEIGWSLLYHDVCVATANRLLGVLRSLAIADRNIRDDIDALRARLETSLRGGTPWRARDALDVIMMLDTAAWAALRELIAECPVLHAAMRARGARSVSASDVEFISDHAQIALVHDFLDALPESLATGR